MTATAAIADGGADAIRSLLITLVGGMERRGEERESRRRREKWSVAPFTAVSKEDGGRAAAADTTTMAERASERAEQGNRSGGGGAEAAWRGCRVPDCVKHVGPSLIALRDSLFTGKSHSQGVCSSALQERWITENDDHIDDSTFISDLLVDPASLRPLPRSRAAAIAVCCLRSLSPLCLPPARTTYLKPYRSHFALCLDA